MDIQYELRIKKGKSPWMTTKFKGNLEGKIERGRPRILFMK